MPLNIVRPQLGSDKRDELQKYIFTQWIRSKTGRQGQVEDDYTKWLVAYEGVPLEKDRTVPFYRASNFVVKLIRIYVDTFIARTLNIIHATQPLYVVEGMPEEWRSDLELYCNRKATYDWNHYWLTRDLCARGNKTGTAIYKTPWVERTTIDVMAANEQQWSEQPYTYFRGPDSKPVPFEDFYVYPITINHLCEAKIKFHRTRWVKEDAERAVAEGDWHLPDDKSLDMYLRHPADARRVAVEAETHVSDPYVLEMSVIEAYLDYAISPSNPSKYYSIVACFEEQTGDIVDVYFQPYPRNLDIFTDYRPFPREDFFYGESMCHILGQCQEEASRIHNERRDNSTIASSVVFKRRNGSQLPNPSTNWYPGKVWDLDDMDDLDVVNIGRNYENMIEQEDYTFSIASQLSGIDDVMKGASSGILGKRGVYNTGGTIAVMAEGNQRQDTNIRDVRMAIGEVARKSLRLQAFFDPSDPLIDTLPQKSRQPIKDALNWIGSDKSRYMRLEVKSSNAGMNSEVQKANLMGIAQVVGQYGQTVMGLATQAMNNQINPGMRMMINDLIAMHTGMARRLLKAFNEWDAIDELPNVAAAIEKAVPGGSAGSTPPGNQPNGGGVELAPPTGPPAGLSRGLLESLTTIPQPNGGTPR